MGSRALVAVLVLAVLALLGALWSSGRENVRRGEGGERAAAGREPASALVPSIASDRAREEVPPLAVEVPSAPAPAPGPDADATLGGRPRAALTVEVQEKDGRPVAGATLELVSWVGPHPADLVCEDERSVHASATTDARGAADLPDVPAGPYSLVARAPDGRRASRLIAHTGRAGLDSTVRLVLPASAAFFLVRVIDARGAPVPAARVHVVGAERDAAIDLTGLTDSDGRARFDTLEPLAVLVLASTDDGRTGKAQLDNRSKVEAQVRAGGMDVVVAAPGSVEGTLRGLEPAALGPARVIAHALTGESPYNRTYCASVAVPVSDGRYRFDALAAGRWTLALDAPGGARLALPRLKWGGAEIANSVDPIEVEVLSGRTSVCDLQVTAGGTLAGVVRRADGSPVQGALVRATYTPENGNFPDAFALRGVNVWRYDAETSVEGRHPVTHPSARTDEAGRYRFAGLFPGVQRVEVFADGLSYDRREDVLVADGGVTELEHVLEPSGAIQGLEPGRGYLGVTKAGEERARMIALVPATGSFTFPGLEAGRYTLSAFHYDTSREPAALVTVEVVAGRTTWVDLSGVQHPIAIRGRVLDARGPVAGARVTIYPTVLVSDDEGRFETSRSFPLTGEFGGVTTTVEHLGVETRFHVPSMTLAETTADWELVLGAESADLVVLGADAAPASATVELERMETDAEETAITYVHVQPRVVEGRLTVDGLAAGDYSASVRFANGAEPRFEFSLPAHEDVVLRAPPTGDLIVTLIGPDGRPAPDWRVATHTWTGEGAAPADMDAFLESSAQRIATADADGRAWLRGVAAGEIAVAVQQKGMWGGASAVRWERLTLRAGEERTLELQVDRPSKAAR